MGTTVATNALLERKGAKTAFVVTKGFRDLLVIGNQSRPKMFDLAINRSEEVYSKVIEVSERVTLEAWSESQEPEPFKASGIDLVKGITGEVVRVLQPISMTYLRRCTVPLVDHSCRSKPSKSGPAGRLR
jgi:5-oxoprolinase (ATP-hydrolysing)